MAQTTLFKLVAAALSLAALEVAATALACWTCVNATPNTTAAAAVVVAAAWASLRAVSVTTVTTVHRLSALHAAVTVLPEITQRICELARPARHVVPVLAICVLRVRSQRRPTAKAVRKLRHALARCVFV